MGAWRTWVEDCLAAGKPWTAYGTHRVVACYTEFADEYRALRWGPAIVDRSYRGLIEVTGADRVDWLHGLVSNQIKSLRVDEGTYAFALSVAGRIQFDLNVFVRPESLWLDLDCRFVDVAQAHLGRHIIMEDVSLTDRSGEFVRLAVAGGNATEALVRLGAEDAPSMAPLSVGAMRWQRHTIDIVRTDFCGVFGVEAFVPADVAVSFWSAMVDPAGCCGATPAGATAVDARRIEAGLPWPGSEITDDVLPAETAQLERAVSFSKGCYLGQEIAERMRSRGALSRHLVGLEVDGGVVPASGAELVSTDGTVVGRVTSACASPARSGVIGLGFVKVAAVDARAPVRVACADGDATVTVVALPRVRSDG